MFRLSGARRSRKQKPDPPEGGIRVRAPREPKKQTLTNKNALLRFIRDQQHHNERAHESNRHVSVAEDDVTDFDDSLEFLMNIAKKVAAQPPETVAQPHEAYTSSMPMRSEAMCGVAAPTKLRSEAMRSEASSPRSNYTLKSTSQRHNVSDILPDTNVSMIFPGSDGPQGHALRLAAPSYGCLKGGVKPTYRQYYQLNTPHLTSMPPSHQHNLTQRQYPPSALMPHSVPPVVHTSNQVTDLVRAAAEGGGSVPKLIYPKQKRTVRRTFSIGKSKTQPKVSVLVSNRTIRRNITTKTHEMKQTSMHDVKLFLIKRGLIRVGTSAPNHVLRQMYESATLLCGDVYNHNPDTLLYNFFNDESSRS